MSPPVHNVVRVLFIVGALALGAACVGGPLAYLGGEPWRKAAIGVGAVAGVACAWRAAAWFEGDVAAKCPTCGGPAWATSEGRRTRYRCDRCGELPSQ